MELKKEQYEQIVECFPNQRKPAKISNLAVLNAALYVMENGCKWRGLPSIKRFRRIFTRYDKLDIIFLAFLYLALIIDVLM